MPEVPEVDEEQIRQYAYMLWQQAGSPDGQPVWEQAKAILTERQSEQSPITP